MAGTILVAYATRYGSTAEVAEAIGARLRERGVEAEVKRVADVASLENVGAVVLGTPLYIGSPLKESVAFLERHRSTLETLPVAYFALGPLSAGEIEQEETRSQLENAVGKTSWLAPVATRLFVGKYDPSKLRLADKLIAVLPASPLHDVPARDERDWEAVASFADALPDALFSAR